MSVGLAKDIRSLESCKWEDLEKMPPKVLAFTINEFCNASCSFCCYRRSKPQNRMRNEIFFKAAEEYHDAGGKRIWLNAMTGESLLDPLFFEKTEFLKTLGSFDTIDLQTNGLLLNRDEIIESLMDSGITTLHVSTAGFEKGSYKRYMGVEKYEDFLSGIVKLLTRNQECGNQLIVDIQVRGLIDVIDTEDFSNKIQPFIDPNKGKVTIDCLRLYTDWLGQVREDDLPKGCGLLPMTRIRTKPCSLSFNLGVLTNGELRLCNSVYGEEGRVDDLRVGNVASEHLMDVWNSSMAKHVRRTTYGKNSNPICQKCRLYEPV